MVPWIVHSALAAPEKPGKAEEIIVYGDQFARWDHTRWSLQSELMMPLGLVFASDENKDFRSFGFQVRAVVLCDKDAALGKRKWEVSCVVEDVGLLATTENRWRLESDRALADEVLTEVDRRITGVRVQMQVDEEGGITNFDIEGMNADTPRERVIQETTRQMLTRVMAGFHLRIPDQAQRSGQWVEYNSELLDIPALSAAQGSTTLLHQVSPYKDMQLVQTVGEGTLTTKLPSDTRDPFHADLAQVGGGGNTTPRSTGIGASSAPTLAAMPGAPSVYQNKESTIAATIKITASGVAVFEKATGIMIERVWEASGRATASSPWGVGAYRNVGRIRRIEPDEVVDVGPTHQVGWPSTPIDGLPGWVPLESVPR